MNSCSSGSTASPSRASSSELRTISSNSISDSGSRQPAIRTATNAAPPIRIAATITPSAMSSSARTAPIELKPWPTTITIRPTDRAMNAASPTRRRLPVAFVGGDERIGCLPERTGDHEPLDLVRALVDLCDLGVSHHPLHGVLLHVTVAAQHLDRLDRHGHRRVRTEDLRHGGKLPGLRMTLVSHRTCLVQKLAAGGRPRFHIGELELDRLELVDRLPELPALAGVADRVVGRALRDSDRLGGRPQAGALERPERHRKTATHLADHVLVWNTNLIEDRLTGRRGADAELVLELAH